MEGITTAVLDEFPHLRLNPLHKAMFLGALCFCFYLMGLLLVTDVSVVFFFFFSERARGTADRLHLVCAHMISFPVPSVSL